MGAIGSTTQSGTKETKTSTQYSGRIEPGDPISAAPEFLENSIGILMRR